MSRRQASSGSAYEDRFGFSRAVRTGPLIAVSGTAPIEPDGSVTPGGAGAQMRRCLAIIAESLSTLGGSLEDVVRTRMYVTNMADWPAVAEAHRERFGHIRPAATIVQVSALVEAAMLGEVEADAWVEEKPAYPRVRKHHSCEHRNPVGASPERRLCSPATDDPCTEGRNGAIRWS